MWREAVCQDLLPARNVREAIWDNPDQRISEKMCHFFVTRISLHWPDESNCTLLSLLYFVEPFRPFAVSILGKEISIPGYMVWVAICYAGLGTFLIHKVGHRLVNLNFVQQRYEADFRFSMMRVLGKMLKV